MATRLHAKKTFSFYLVFALETYNSSQRYGCNRVKEMVLTIYIRFIYTYYIHFTVYILHILKGLMSSVSMLKFGFGCKCYSCFAVFTHQTLPQPRFVSPPRGTPQIKRRLKTWRGCTRRDRTGQTWRKKQQIF